MSSTDIFGLQFTIFVMGGLGLLAVTYASILYRKAKRQRTAIGHAKYLTKVFHLLTSGAPALILGVMAAIIFLAEPSVLLIVVVLIVGLASIGSILWFVRKHQRALIEYGSTVIFEDEVRRLGEEG